MPGWGAGGSQGSHAQVSTGHTLQVPREEMEEVEHDRGFQAAEGLLWGGRAGSVAAYHLGSPLSPDTGHSLVTHLLWSLVQPVQPVLEAASGPGACWGLSLDLWAEAGGV